jgi:Predicted membrane protein
MNSAIALSLSLGIGIVAGLRSLTAPAVVAWAANLRWINLQGSPLSFMGSKWTAAIFTVLALVELVADQLPKTPPRTAAVGLSARIVTGALSGACLALAGGAVLSLGALLGAVGGVAGAFGGYQARVGLVRALKVPDFAVAVPEDIFAIGLGLLLASRF